MHVFMLKDVVRLLYHGQVVVEIMRLPQVQVGMGFTLALPLI